MKKQKFKITRINGYDVKPPIYLKMSVRGQHSSKWMKKTRTRCNGCGDIIEIGEQYFYDEGKPFCLGCVDYD